VVFGIGLRSIRSLYKLVDTEEVSKDQFKKMGWLNKRWVNG